MTFKISGTAQHNGRQADSYYAIMTLLCADNSALSLRQLTAYLPTLSTAIRFYVLSLSLFLSLNLSFSVPV